MSISPARQIAFEILLRVEDQQAFAAELLHSERVSALTQQDRGLCTELVMGVLRWRSHLDGEIARFSFTPFRKLDREVLTALRLGVYQLEFLLRIPARAAINESVELVKRSRKASAAPLTNAVLRKIPKTPNEVRLRRHAGELQPDSGEPVSAETLARDFAHPAWLVERWTAHFGAPVAAAICRYDQQIPRTALRLRDPNAESELQAAGIVLEPGALMSSARRVAAGDPTHTRTCAEHRVVVQDEASQLVAALVGRGSRILDCCAAPGGKTLALADRNPQAQLIAAEIHEHRARLLRARVPASHVRIITADARALPLAGGFDRVLVDAPCSGTGTLARNPEIRWRLTPADLEDLQQRQLALLRAALDQVAPGGRVVYSSCSLEPEENERVVEQSIEGTTAYRLIDCGDELRRLQLEDQLASFEVTSVLQGPYLRTMPGLQPCDGFFAAILERLA